MSPRTRLALTAVSYLFGFLPERKRRQVSVAIGSGLVIGAALVEALRALEVLEIPHTGELFDLLTLIPTTMGSLLTLAGIIKPEDSKEAKEQEDD